jgi:hypothetical protein
MDSLVISAHVLAAIFMALAALIACTNVFITFLRPLYHWLRNQECKFVSVIPGIGTIFLILAAPILAVNHPSSHPWFIKILCALILIFDTGGLPWFAAIMIIMWLRGKKMWSSQEARPPVKRAD